MKPFRRLFAFLPLFLLPAVIYAGTGSNMVHQMMMLVFQLTVIIFAAKYTGKLFRRIHLPDVIGELFAGMLIGPYLLGGIPLPGLANGLFGDFLIGNPAATLPVSPELYAFSVVASILLLFMVGLETDINLFMRFSLPGFVIGGLGVVASFFSGAYVASLFLNAAFMDPRVLFLGVMSTATSVGITARILTGRKKINSPEGVTILGSAVIDDVLGIILLAVVIGISAGQQGGLDWGYVGRISLKALAVWVAFTAFGLIFAPYIGKFLKTFKQQSTIGIMSFGLALLLAGIFESAGLAMIIGAYVMGLSLSKTDLSYVIQESLHNIYAFFIPIFFCISGMFVNPRVFSSGEVLLFGLVYALSAYLAKILGCGLPARFFKFNVLGAARIGVGMVPRGEVALIIISIGLAHGILSEELTGVGILMVLLTSVLAPVHLDKLLKKKQSGVEKGLVIDEHVQTDYHFPSAEISDFVAGKLVRYFQEEGFYINLIEGDEHIYHVRRQNIFLSFHFSDKTISFFCDNDDVAYIKNIMYETLVNLHQTIENLKSLVKPDELQREMKRDMISKEGKVRLPLEKILNPDAIIMHLAVSRKENIIRHLVDKLDELDLLIDRDEVLKTVLEREKSMSTGMQHGVALPHGKSDAAKKMCMAVGLKPEGCDFGSLDGKDSRVIILVISRKQSSDPHIQLLSEIGNKLYSDEAVEKLLKCTTKEEVWNFFVK
jgi:Kef-type K+ transport system membrane component KefB/mannitol/fructose-specific phosphotransferase system IIA component (Ntr-type)